MKGRSVMGMRSTEKKMSAVKKMVIVLRSRGMRVLQIFVWSCFVANLSYAEWTNSLKAVGVDSTFVATTGGSAQCVILIPQAPLPTEIKAAEELSEWLFEIGGVTIPTVSETAIPVEGAVISVGNTDLAASTDLTPLSEGIEDEGYAIIAKDGNLFLLGGNRRGPLYAVYALLEEDLGCRWYTAKRDDVIPTMVDLTISFVPRQYNPILTTREASINEGFNTPWALKNRVNPKTDWGEPIPHELGGQLTTPPGNANCHTFLKFMPLADYWDEHPEYYSKDTNGVPYTSYHSLCMSNSNVVNIVTEKVRTLFRDNPDLYVGLSPDDAHRLCQCPECKALNDAAGGTQMGALLTFLNNVAVNIKDEFPDRKILTLAYLNYAAPPTNMTAESKSRRGHAI